MEIVKPISNVFNEDCMEGMKRFPDKFFELAVVDPPYGGGNRFNFRYSDDPNKTTYENIKPDKEYFTELFRVSKNQIIWGGNYFTDLIPVSRCWISWYKGQPIDSFSDFELAWTSFDKRSRCIKLESYGFNHADKRHSGLSTIHPTQKPVSLYRWLLLTYASTGDKILDTHCGSQSSRIASFLMGFDYYGFELDTTHFTNGNKRFKSHTEQLEIF